MFLSNRRLAVFLLFCLLTECVGQMFMLSAAPHPQSLRSISHRVERRIAAGLQRHFLHAGFQRRISTQTENSVTVCVTVCVTGEACPAP